MTRPHDDRNGDRSFPDFRKGLRVLLAVSLLLLDSALPISAVEPANQAARKELAKLQGTWRLVELEIDGEVIEYAAEAQPRWFVKKDRVAREEGGKPWGCLAVDPALVSNTLDLSRVGEARPMEAIYSLEKDTWRICVNTATAGIRERPAGFSTKGKPGWKIWVLKREKR